MAELCVKMINNESFPGVLGYEHKIRYYYI
jgi:hypothetical protein